MPEPIDQVESASHAERSIRKLIDAHHEWFLIQNDGAPLAILREEFDLSAAQGRLIFSSWTERGARAWRISRWEWKSERLVLQATRGMGREAATLELIPRASARALMASIAAARQTRCEMLAQLVAQFLGNGCGVLGVRNQQNPDPHTHTLTPIPCPPASRSNEPHSAPGCAAISPAATLASCCACCTNALQ